MKLLRKVLRLKKKVGRVPCAAVIPAAGLSTRMGTDKLMLPLGDVPILIRTLRVFAACDWIDEIVVPVHPERVEEMRALFAQYKLLKLRVVAGGATRSASVLAGVRAVSPGMELVAVHDAARPFITDALIVRCVECAATYHAAAPAVPIKDTVKEVAGGLVKKTIPRETLRAVQTPQVFDRELLIAALSNAEEHGIAVTDDCAAVEKLGMSVYLTEGDYTNIKITTREDLVFARAILNQEEEL